jgi:hypothetical protein
MGGDMGAGQAPSESAAFRSVTSGAGFGSTTAVGYIDTAIPLTQLRIRFDAGFDDNEPDRAAVFYAKCGCFPGAPGPGPNPNSKVNFQELYGYLEYAQSDRFLHSSTCRFVSSNKPPSRLQTIRATTVKRVDFPTSTSASSTPC